LCSFLKRHVKIPGEISKRPLSKPTDWPSKIKDKNKSVLKYYVRKADICSCSTIKRFVHSSYIQIQGHLCPRPHVFKCQARRVPGNIEMAVVLLPYLLRLFAEVTGRKYS
jgi:hypothetical protein